MWKFSNKYFTSYNPNVMLGRSQKVFSFGRKYIVHDMKHFPSIFEPIEKFSLELWIMKFTTVATWRLKSTGHNTHTYDIFIRRLLYNKIQYSNRNIKQNCSKYLIKKKYYHFNVGIEEKNILRICKVSLGRRSR